MDQNIELGGGSGNTGKKRMSLRDTLMNLTEKWLWV